MKTTLKIDHQEYLFDSTEKAISAMKALAGAVQVRERSPYNDTTFLLEGHAKLSLRTLSEKVKFLVEDEAT